MKAVRTVASHSLTGQTLRFVIAGCTVAVVYLAIPLLLNGALAVPIEMVIPIAYLLAVSLHFTLQRHFVFRHVSEFALTTRGQIMRYVAIGVVQYPTTAVLTAVLPAALGVSSRAVFVGVTIGMSMALFVILRTHIFHPADAS